MRIFTRAFLIMLSFTLLTSCGMLQTVNTNVLKIGMTKEEAQSALKIKPSGIVAAKNFPEAKTIVEVVHYYTQMSTNGYWLYFNNNKLSKWEPASSLHQPYIDDLVPIL